MSLELAVLRGDPPRMSGTDDVVARRALALRQRLGMTQDELAHAAGVGRTQITKLELGQNKATGVGLRLGLAKAAGVELDEISKYFDGVYTLDDVMALSRHNSQNVRGGARGASPEGAREASDPAHARGGDGAILGSEWEEAIIPALDPRRHRLEDVDAVRTAIRTTRQLTRDVTDPRVLAADLLDAAASLREEGIAASPLEVFVRAAVRAERALAAASRVEEKTEEMNGNGEKELHALGGKVPAEPARPPKKHRG